MIRSSIDLGSEVRRCRGCSSVGRASAFQAECRRFEPVHPLFENSECGRFRLRAALRIENADRRSLSGLRRSAFWFRLSQGRGRLVTVDQTRFGSEISLPERVGLLGSRRWANPARSDCLFSKGRHVSVVSVVSVVFVIFVVPIIHADRWPWISVDGRCIHARGHHRAGRRSLR